MKKLLLLFFLNVNCDYFDDLYLLIEGENYYDRNTFNSLMIFNYRMVFYNYFNRLARNEVGKQYEQLCRFFSVEQVTLPQIVIFHEQQMKSMFPVEQISEVKIHEQQMKPMFPVEQISGVKRGRNDDTAVNNTRVRYE